MTESLPEFSEELGSIFSEPDKHAEAEEIPLADVTWPKFGEHYANVTCEQIGLDVPLYYGDSMEIMRVGARTVSGQLYSRVWQDDFTQRAQYNLLFSAAKRLQWETK